MKIRWSNCKFLTMSFIIGGVFDIIMQLSAAGKIPPMDNLFGDHDWYKSLVRKGGYYDNRKRPVGYFALAGLGSFLTQSLILLLVPFPKKISHSFMYLFISFVVGSVVSLRTNSAYGISGGLFPDISDTYYKDLGKIKSMVYDGVSSVTVSLALIILVFSTR